MSIKACIWALVICVVTPAGGAAQTVYFSAGKEIRTLDLTSTGTTLVHTSAMFVGDLALCAGNPDNPADASVQYLYFVERDAAGGDRISRLDIRTALPRRVLANPTATTVFTVPVEDGRVGEIRLATGCDVIFATSEGVFRVSGSTPFSTEATPVENADGSNITASAGSGLALAFDGSLRYSDGAALKSTLAGFGATSAAAPIVGIGIANAGAGSIVPALTALSVGPVCVSTLNAVKCGPKPGGGLATTLATFSVPGSTAVNNAQFFEFLTNDTAIVATSVDPNAGLGGAAKYNGILWKVDAAGATELTRGLKVNGVFVPIVGVAVGPSIASATTAGTTHAVNFGPVAFDVVTPLSCTLSITWRQLLWTQALAKLNSVNAGLPSDKYLLDRGLGGESWVDDVEVSPSGNCGLSPSTPAQVGIAQYIENVSNRAVLHCHGNNCDVVTQGNFPYSTPEDERDSATPDNFSDFLTATVASTTSSIVFSVPLSNAAVVSGAIDQAEIAAATTHNVSGGLAIRFRICANDACTVFAPVEQPNPPTSGAGLSVTRLTNGGVALADCVVNDEGGANPDLPVFRVSGGDGVTHVFNLDTPPEGPGPCQLNDLSAGQAGLFVATVFSHGGSFSKTSILFWLTK